MSVDGWSALQIRNLEAEKASLVTQRDALRHALTETMRWTDGVGLIASERQRQKEQEGWTPEHDDEHRADELRRAARCYVDVTLWPDHADLHRDAIPHEWPWDGEWWNPSPDPIRNLIKAGALIAAEIDRLQRVFFDALSDAGFVVAESKRAPNHAHDTDQPRPLRPKSP